MSKTTLCREHHQELLDVVGSLSPLLKVDELGKDATGARRLLTTLAAKYNIHLAMEDKAFYPLLVNHKDSKVSSTAKKFQEEMGGIKTAFGEYLSRWPSPGSIQKNAEVFIKETHGIIQVLGKRIKAENEELYDLADKAE